MNKKLLFLVSNLLVAIIGLSQTTFNLSSAGTLSVLAEQTGIKVDTITRLKLNTSTSCDLPEIIYFRIKHIAINDEWTADITFEFDAKNVEKYRLSQDCFDLGFGTDFSINKDDNEYTIKNVEKDFTNYFNLYAINACSEESKYSEIILDPIPTAVETNPVDSIEIKVLASNMVITNPFDRNLSLKVYSVQGVCLLAETLMSGKNVLGMQQWSNVAIIRIEDKGKILLTKKIITRLR